MDQKTIIQRLESNGSLDQQYGINAKIEVQLDEGINSIHDIKWDNLQHLLITGSTSNYNSYILRLANDIETAVINADEIKNPILIYPNPTHKQFKVNFYSECNTDYVINLLNESGQKIKTLYQANFPVGEQTIDLQVGDELVSGNYFIELMSLNKKRVLKLIVCE
ncbi:MAG: T9SS type A sorting domain-containing protein [Saprospiraceae bacterium]